MGFQGFPQTRKSRLRHNQLITFPKNWHQHAPWAYQTAEQKKSCYHRASLGARKFDVSLDCLTSADMHENVWGHNF